MALKQINHPDGLIPSWANNDDMVDPAKPWDATPTKVEPGAGKRDAGYLPEENPTGQHLNQKLNELGRWVQYLSSIQVMNWFDTGPPSDKDAGDFNNGDCIIYDEGFIGWICVGGGAAGASVVQRSGDGETWRRHPGTFSAAGFHWTWAATKPPNDAPTHGGVNTLISNNAPSATNIVNEILVGVVNTGTVPGTGTSAINHHVWNRFQQRWIFVGGTNLSVTPVPEIWTTTTPIAAALTQRLPAAVNSTECELVAGDESGSGLIVVVGNATPFDVWTSTDAITFTRATPTGITAGQSAKSLLWDTKRQLFVLLTEKETYTSVNGTAWTQISVVPGTGDDFQLRCFDYDGGALYVAAADSPTVSIRYSRDGGLTWRVVNVPPTEDPGDGGTTDPITGVFYSRGQGRFAALWGLQADGSDGNVALSLAMGESLYDADAVTISIPTVT